MTEYKMSRLDAINIVTEIASRWAENMEEGFVERLDADDDDATMLAKAGEDWLDEATEVRDVWRAVATLAGRLGENKAVTVYDYFERALGVAPQDETLRDLPVDSNCGSDCKQVIDVAREYLAIADSHPRVRDAMLASVNAAVEVFWRG